MEIAIQSELTEDEANHLFKWSECVFPIEGGEFEWAKPQRSIVARDNGLAIAHVGFGLFKVIGDNEKAVIGVGAVVVRPEYQGQGIPEKMFDVLNATRVLNAAREAKTLFCPGSLVSYYERHGYKEYCYPVKFMQKNGYTETDNFRFMVRGNLGFFCEVSIPSFPW